MACLWQWVLSCFVAASIVTQQVQMVGVGVGVSNELSVPAAARPVLLLCCLQPTCLWRQAGGATDI